MNTTSFLLRKSRERLSQVFSRFVFYCFLAFLLRHGIGETLGQTHVSTTPAAPPQGAPVKLEGRTLFHVYMAFKGTTPEQRAKDISLRLKAAADDRLIPLGEVQVATSEVACVVTAGNRYLFAVTEDDAKAEGKPLMLLAESQAELVKSALRDYRKAHSVRGWTVLILQILGAWAIFLGICVGLQVGLKKFRSFIESINERMARSATLGGFHQLFGARMSALLLVVIRFFALALVLFLLSFLIPFSLSPFPALEGDSIRILGFLIEAIRTLIQRIIAYLPNLAFLAVLFLISFYLARAMKALAQGVEKGLVKIPGFYADWARPTYQVFLFVLVLFTVVMSFPYLPGGNTDAFKGVSIFIGVLVSLGSTSIVGNIVSGIILIYMRPFKVGDRVRIGESYGDVIGKNLLVTRVRTIKNVDITVPNSTILSSHVLNYSAEAKENGLILNTSITIGYDTPWRIVHQLLIEAAKATDGILADPTPFVFQTSLNDFHVSYEINAYTEQPNHIDNLYAKLHQNIQDKFDEAGVEIMSPSYYSLRDGNKITIPRSFLPADYRAPGFRVQDIKKPREEPET